MASTPYGAPGGPDIETLKKLAQSNAAASTNSQLGDLGLDFSLPASAIPQQNNADYQAMARQMYEPQFGFLDAQSAAAQKRAAQNKASLGNLYNQVAKQILGEKAGINQNYGHGIADTQGAYQGAMGDVAHTFDKSRDDQLAILQRLGIEQAAPNTLNENAAGKSFIEGVLGANNQASTNALRQMQNSALTFNTEQGNITKQAGAEQQAGVGKQLEDVLMQLAGRRADLMGNVNQSAMSMQSDASKLAQQQQQDAYNRAKDERDFSYKVGHDKAAMDLQLQLKQMGGAGNSANSDPLGKVNALASSLYPNSQSAATAVKAVTDALRDEGGNMHSVNDLIKSVYDRNMRANGRVGDLGNLTRLAALAWGEMYGKSTAPGATPYGG